MDMTKEQIQEDYKKLMNSFVDNPLFENSGDLNPNVYFEQFSIFDKSLQSTATTSFV